jgi:hypothetical protein
MSLNALLYSPCGFSVSANMLENCSLCRVCRRSRATPFPACLNDSSFRAASVTFSPNTTLWVCRRSASSVSTGVYSFSPSGRGDPLMLNFVFSKRSRFGNIFSNFWHKRNSKPLLIDLLDPSIKMERIRGDMLYEVISYTGLSYVLVLECVSVTLRTKLHGSISALQHALDYYDEFPMLRQMIYHTREDVFVYGF